MKISRATIIRTVLLLVAIINAVLQIFGKETLPFTDEEIKTLKDLVIEKFQNEKERITASIESKIEKIKSKN